ncbi:92111f1d-1614-465a-bf8a-96d48c5a5867 [Sclerotinia trifoliorum]|uniref:92111f1d-1614-465a-bf8a-96d48c5a5867 n=1 Tax=Sclerotinia trifoliorum TaxID=28548 RepID=A0A8H2W3P7_9HELO|nr:92111f1d-1614-465a-bf8a-96d48c5a5867 [Sclerotinia trifoliorum]
MSGLFRKTKNNAPENATTSSQKSSGDRPKQERRYSETRKSETSNRPHLFKSKTWHISGGNRENLTADELRPKLPKSPKKNVLVKSFFSTKSRKASAEEDDSDDEFWHCKGGEGTGMLVGDGSLSRRDANHRRPANANARDTIPSRSKPNSGHLQRRVSTRKTRVTSKPTMPNSRSSPKDLSASRTAATSSVPSSTNSRSPYGKSSTASSFLNPRSISSVYNQGGSEKLSSQTRSFNDSSESEVNRRGRDGRNLRREGCRKTEGHASDDSTSSGENHDNRFRSSNHTSKTSTNNTSNQKRRLNEEKKKQNFGTRARKDDYYDYSGEIHDKSRSSRNEYKLPSTRARELVPSAQRAVVVERGAKNKVLPIIPVDTHNPHFV